MTTINIILIVFTVCVLMTVFPFIVYLVVKLGRLGYLRATDIYRESTYGSKQTTEERTHISKEEGERTLKRL